MNLRKVNKDLIDTEFTQEVDNHIKTIASTDTLGHIKVDGSTITVDPLTGIASAQEQGYQLTEGSNARPYNGDLNNLVESGFYIVNANTSNAFYTSKHMVQVIASPEQIVQIAYQSSTNSLDAGMYKRQAVFSGGNFVWSANPFWRRLDLPDFLIPNKMTSIYVDGTLGTDEIGKGTGAGVNAFKTIAYALSRVSIFNISTVIIRISAGTYNENISVYGNKGGYISFIGAGVNSTIVNSVTLSDCDNVRFTGITSVTGFDIRAVNYFALQQCSKTASNNSYGLYVLASNGFISGSTFSNSTSSYGIYCSNNSILALDTVSGTGNTTGIYCELSVVRKKSSTITGTTAQTVVNGGQIV